MARTTTHPAPLPDRAEVLLRGAPVYAGGSWAGDCLAVADGRILGFGTVDDVAGLVDARTRERDLGGAWLLPAFHDAHAHPVAAGLEAAGCDLTGEVTVEGYLARVQAYADAHPQRAWVTGGGWSMSSFPRGVPRAALLDAVCDDRPVYLPNRDHHSAWVNSAALRLAGLTATTPDPADGRVERDDAGEPTGALHEGAMRLVADLVPDPTPGELLEALVVAQAHLHRLGVVGWQDALVGRGLGMQDTLPTYLRAQRDGLLTAKVVAALWWDRDRGPEQLPDLVERREAARAEGFRATSVKVMQDGVCETFTAAVLHPYLGADGRPTHNHGLSFLDPGDLAACVTRLDAEDFQVHVHALGDRAVRDSLDAVAAARSRNGPRGNRHHLAHLQIVHPDDVRRFAGLGVTANAQPLWACRDEQMEELTLPFLPEPARERQYVFRSLLSAGARLAFGSDWPVSSPDPLEGIHVAVNRRAPGAGAVPPLLPHEGLTIAEALHAYTAGSAYVNRAETATGTIAVGRAADLVAVDRDVLGTPADELATTRVTHTFVDGVAVVEP